MYNYFTKNKSFMEVSERLKKRGIKNYRFMLELQNESLQFVDPYDPNLPEKIKKDIINECKNNIWYFFREVLRITTSRGSTVPFKLDLTSCAQIYCFIKNNNCWVTKPRQLGSTICCLSLSNYTRIFHSGSKSYIVGRNINNSNSLKERSDSYIKALPDYLELFDMKEDNTVEVFTFNRLKDEIIESGYLYIDEAEFVPKIKSIYEKLKSERRLTLYNAYDQVNSVQLVSTISDNAQGAEKLLDESIRWYDLFYDVDFETLTNFVLSSSTGLIHIYNSYEELGLGDDWYRTMCALLNNDEDVIRREILLKRR